MRTQATGHPLTTYDAQLTASDHYDVSPPPRKADPFMHIDAGKFMSALAIAYIGIVGCFVYGKGFAGLQEGLSDSGNLNSCSWNGSFTALAFLAPLTCVLRVFLAPAMWVYLGERRDLLSAVTSIPVWGWMLCYWVPFVHVTRIVFNVAGGLGSPDDMMKFWPDECNLDRPYPALFQTGCYVLLASFVTEGIMHIIVIMRCSNLDERCCAFAAPTTVFNVLLLLTGPVLFFMSFDENAVCDDLWIQQTLLGVAVASAIIKLTLILAPFGMMAAVKSQNAVFGPFAYWSTINWLLLAIAEIIVLETVFSMATVIKDEAPETVCGAGFKEFWFSRQKALVYYNYGELVAYMFWIVGMWLWGPLQALYA